MVLLHGWAMHSVVWRSTIEPLARRFRVTTIDLPGHGNNRDVAFKDLESVTRLLVSAAPESAVWMGWSLGGLLATQVTVTYPERVKKLVTVASSPRFLRSGDWNTGLDESLLDDIYRRLDENVQKTIKHFFALQFLGAAADRTLNQSILHSVLEQSADKRALVAGLNVLKTTDLRREFAKINQPVLSIFGGKDRLVHPDTGKESVFDHSQVVVMASAGHLPFVSHADVFLNHISAFV